MSTQVIENNYIKPFIETENIFPVAVPVPFFPSLITANIYLLIKDPITMIDTGPKVPRSLEFMPHRTFVWVDTTYCGKLQTDLNISLD